MDVGIIHRDERSAAFFDAAAQETLLIKRCGGCDAWLGPEAGGCPGCGAVGADGLIWAPASGQGILISWAVGVQAHFAHPEVGESLPFFRRSSGPAQPGNR